MLRRLSSSLETGREEAQQLLRKASSRFSGLLSGYRSLSVHSDDLDRHEYGAPCRTLCHGCSIACHRPTSTECLMLQF